MKIIQSGGGGKDRQDIGDVDAVRVFGLGRWKDR
jgi:hypothetical protein